MLDQNTKEAATIRVRSSPIFDEFIEFEVSLSEIPFDHGVGKNVIVNWKMFDGFEANKTFWTDSNGLEMQEREIGKYGAWKLEYPDK